MSIYRPEIGEHVLVAHRDDWDAPANVRWAGVYRLRVTGTHYDRVMQRDIVVGDAVDARTGTQVLMRNAQVGHIDQPRGPWAECAPRFLDALGGHAADTERYAVRREVAGIRLDLMRERLQALGLPGRGMEVYLDTPDGQGRVVVTVADLTALLARA